jgi:hypothetical protein
MKIKELHTSPEIMDVFNDLFKTLIKFTELEAARSSFHSTLSVHTQIFFNTQISSLVDMLEPMIGKTTEFEEFMKRDKEFRERYF